MTVLKGRNAGTYSALKTALPRRVGIAVFAAWLIQATTRARVSAHVARGSSSRSASPSVFALSGESAEEQNPCHSKPKPQNVDR
jgi:hypothetical protein